MSTTKSKKKLVDVRNIEEDTLANKSYRKVLYTVPKQMQLVVMSLAPGESIPCETHRSGSQFVRVESGNGVCTVGKTKKTEYVLSDGISLTISPGVHHCFTNVDNRKHLKMYLLYSPPEHPNSRHQQRQPTAGRKRKAQAAAATQSEHKMATRQRK